MLSLAPDCLPADADQDGIPNVTDCDRETPGGSPPAPVQALMLDRVPSGDLTLSWDSQPGAGGSTDYDVSRGDLGELRASGFPAAAVCAAAGLPDASYLEPASVCSLTP